MFGGPIIIVQTYDLIAHTMKRPVNRRFIPQFNTKCQRFFRLYPLDSDMMLEIWIHVFHIMTIPVACISHPAGPHKKCRSSSYTSETDTIFLLLQNWEEIKIQSAQNIRPGWRYRLHQWEEYEVQQETGKVLWQIHHWH